MDAVYTSDEAKRRFEILARQVFIRFKALLMEPTAFAYAERHDNIEAIYKKLTERRDTADVTELLKELHRIVNEAIRTQAPGDDQAEGLTFDLSQIDLEKLRDEFAKKVRRKATALQDIREIVEQKLAQMLARNPPRMDYQRKYEEIVADYNREKDRATIEETFRRLVELVDEPRRGAEARGRGGAQRGRTGAVRPAEEGQPRARPTREQVKQASRDLLGVDQGTIGRARPILGEGTDQGGCRGVHPRRGLRQACRRRRSHRKRKERLQGSLCPCLAAGCQQPFRGDGMMRFPLSVTSLDV